jgi:hypothetical protein
MPEPLTIALLKAEATIFARRESAFDEPSLYGLTDGKAVGTYLEQKFQYHLQSKYICERSSSAKGIDFPELLVDIKTTSIKKPQSSCPYKSARQKVFGLGYHLLIFVYEKTDDHITHTGRLNILHTIFVDSTKTADFQVSTGLRKILDNDGNLDDVVAFFHEKMLPLDDIQAQDLAEEVLRSPPAPGYLTISNALQWRLHYSRVIDKAGTIDGIERL